MESPPSSSRQPDQDRFDRNDRSNKRKNPGEQLSSTSLLNFKGTLATTVIFIICSAVLVFGNMLQLFEAHSFAFSPGNGMWFPGLVSHMFTHADYLGPAGVSLQFPMHYLGNMCMLVFLGGAVERIYGRFNFLLVFFVSGIFAALAQASFNPSSFLIGASGGLAGILACFARHFPHAKLLIWFILPMPVWLFALLWIGINIVGTVGFASMGVAFIAHLGGFLAGGVVSFILFAPQKTQIGDRSR